MVGWLVRRPGPKRGSLSDGRDLPTRLIARDLTVAVAIKVESRARPRVKRTCEPSLIAPFYTRTNTSCRAEIESESALQTPCHSRHVVSVALNKSDSLPGYLLCKSRARRVSLVSRSPCLADDDTRDTSRAEPCVPNALCRVRESVVFRVIYASIEQRFIIVTNSLS